MNQVLDAIVVGSGFGGAVAACRLAENGYRVLVLERGRRWQPEDYPRDADDAWVWDNHHPEKRNGWFDIRYFPHMAVAQGSGVGGGSLVYANISVEAKADLFDKGWPPEITLDELRPYYDKVGQMLDLQRLPPGQWTNRTRLLKEAAEKTGHGERFRPLDLAVSFDENWSYSLEEPHDPRHSQRFVNQQGLEQGTCIHLGNCDIGCEVQARNTLDLNYIPRAEKHGAEVRPLHIVRSVEPTQAGYRVYYDQIRDHRLVPGSAEARILVIAAGSLSSTELLLRCRDKFRTLLNVSPRLGLGWSSNGDFLTPALHPARDISPTRGPTISAAIDFLDGSVKGQSFFVEDGGFPDLISVWLDRASKGLKLRLRERVLLRTIRRLLSHADPLMHTMPWFAQGRDASDGRLRLRRRWLIAGPRLLHLDWDIDRSKQAIDAIADMHNELAEATGGLPLTPLTWTIARYLISPHPLGGCNLGETPENGVVDHKGEVFGYRNLYVSDGAIVPEAIGANPSKTIAALSERVASLIVKDGR